MNRLKRPGGLSEPDPFLWPVQTKVVLLYQDEVTGSMSPHPTSPLPLPLPSIPG